MRRSWSVRAVVLLALTAVPLSAFAGTAEAAAHSAVDTEKFCDAAMSLYDGSLQVDKNGAYADPAAMAASARASAPYAPAKVRAAALSLAKVYADVAKVSGSQAQAQRYASLYAKAAKPTKTYFGYYGKTCGGTGATSGGANSSGSGNLAVNLTIAAAGALPEKKLTSTTSPSLLCTVESPTNFEIASGNELGLPSGDGLKLTNYDVRVVLGDLFGTNAKIVENSEYPENVPAADYVEVTTDSSGKPTLRITNLPLLFDSAGTKTATTMSGTVTCPKS